MPTPPVDKLPDIIKAGGIPAAIGAGIAALLSWPSSHTVMLAGIPVKSYHSGLGGSTLSHSDAVLAMFGCVIVGALIGMAVGWLIVALKLSDEKTLHMEE